MKKSTLSLFVLCFITLLSNEIINAQTFVHPGGLHTKADLDRMKAQVAAGTHPWIDDWNLLIQDPLAKNTYVASPKANMGDNRQGASKDAHAAYLNAIRWYVSGDVSYADCAIRILNAWSSTVNQVPSGGEFVGLGGIAIGEFAMAAEVMRTSTRWQAGDFTRFKTMMTNYLYPVCHDFLTNHNGRCIQYYWANWDANNIMALIAIGVLCDNRTIFNEGVEYFKTGGGTGSIKNAVPFVHSANLGQWQEAGRDQTHGFLGVGFLATACQIAWNQGVDLFGYDNNRLLAGAEYVAKYNLGEDVPFSTYDNCQVLNHDWPAINGRGIFHDRPVYEMVYNHYVVRKGLSAPFTQKMAQIMRPEKGSIDHFGYGTLTFTMNSSSIPVSPVPPAPANLTAKAGTGRVFVAWKPSANHTMRGYNLQRATASGGPYTTISSSDLNTSTSYTDTQVTNGTTYYYRVAGFNKAGTGAYSAVSNAKPLATGGLPSGWSKVEIGSHNAGNATYANVSGGTFVVNGYGTGIGGTADNVIYVYRQATGESTITGRISNTSGALSKIGIMIRESLNANARTVAMTLGEGGGRFARMGYRTSVDGSMASTVGNTYTWVPAWFRITRSGNTFTAYESSNGTTWFQVASATISMSSTYYVGLAVASGNATSQNTSIFDNVTITGASSGGVELVTGVSGLSGTFQIKNRATGLVIDGYGRTANEDPVSQYSSTTTSSNSHWKIIDAGSSLGAFYYLQNVGTGMKMDGYGRTTNGDDVAQYASSTTSINAQWVIQQYDGYYRIQNRGTGMFMDGVGRTANGDPVGQYTNTTHVNAQWQLITVSSTLKSGSYSDLSTNSSPIISNPILIYPTISSDGVFTLTTDNIASVSVYNISGRLIKLLPAVVSGATFTLLESQMYIVKVVDANGVSKVFKITKQ
jgi:regulation of enolase protein 1 (concanavalin A-like superfamily)